MITVEQVDFWCHSQAENQRIEFKEAKIQYDTEKLCRYCVALANEGGGYLVLGISDRLPRAVVGTRAFEDIVGTAEKLFQWLGFRVDIEEVAHPDGRVLVFAIPTRPVGTVYHYKGAYLMRSGEELVPMTEDRLRKIFTEGHPNWLLQSASSNLNGEQVLQYLDVHAFYELIGMPLPTTQDAILEKLMTERLIEKVNNTYNILNIGAILLAKQLSDFVGVSRKAPRVIVYEGASKLNTISDRVMHQGYAVGFIELVAYVMDKLPQNETIETVLRRSVKLVPEVVVRELIANALIHQDFEISGTSPMIEIYSDRVEFSNAGSPIVPVDRFIDGYRSRNEQMADLMRRFGICEEKSSGIDRVVQAAEIMQLPAPDFLDEYHRTTVVVYGARSFREMTGTDRVRACYQHCVLQYVLRQQMTNQSLRERFGLSEGSSNTVSQIITTTMERGLVKNDPNAPESRRYARYIPSWA